MHTSRTALILLLAASTACSAQRQRPTAVKRPPESGERFFTGLTQITFGGQNAEAYFSHDGRRLVLQRTENDSSGCDQEYVIGVDGTGLRRISNGDGRTTCGYFYDDDHRVLYSSTFAHERACPPRPDYSHGYVWALYEYDIYTSALDGSDIQRLTSTPGYDAEAVLSPDGRKIAFTSVRDGDLDIYTMNVDGSDVRRLTTTPGYDGGPFFSPDSKQIVYRAWHPKTPREIADYKALLAKDLVQPLQMELWVMNADGSNQRQITHLGGASFAPYFHPDGKRIIFASNYREPTSRNFDLYLINLDGSGLVQVTTSKEFDAFPMFSPNGKQLVFASNRFGSVPGETNIFLADWVEQQ
jgi:TolB protein